MAWVNSGILGMDQAFLRTADMEPLIRMAAGIERQIKRGNICIEVDQSGNRSVKPVLKPSERATNIQ